MRSRKKRDENIREIPVVNQTDVAVGGEITSEQDKRRTMIEDERKKIQNAYYEIGKLYVSMHQDDCEPAFENTIHTIAAAEQKIREHKKIIDEINSGKRCQCGTELIEGMVFCYKCGKRIQKETQEEVIICKKCGSPIKKGVNFCVVCGTPVDAAPQYKICRKCRYKNDGNALFCINCGSDKLDAM